MGRERDGWSCGRGGRASRPGLATIARPRPASLYYIIVVPGTPGLACLPSAAASALAPCIQHQCFALISLPWPTSTASSTPAMANAALSSLHLPSPWLGGVIASAASSPPQTRSIPLSPHLPSPWFGGVIASAVSSPNRPPEIEAVRGGGEPPPSLPPIPIAAEDVWRLVWLLSCWCREMQHVNSKPGESRRVERTGLKPSWVNLSLAPSDLLPQADRQVGIDASCYLAQWAVLRVYALPHTGVESSYGRLAPSIPARRQAAACPSRRPLHCLPDLDPSGPCRRVQWGRTAWWRCDL